MTALAISAGPECHDGATAARLPSLLTSRNVAPDGADSGKRGRKAPTCSEIMLPEELDARRSTTVCVRNTFIHTSAQRSPSLEGFYRERGVRTCPSARIGLLEGLFRSEGSMQVEIPEGPPDTPCDVKTPTYMDSIRTPCGVDMPLEREWAQMDNSMPWHGQMQSYVPPYQFDTSAMGSYVPSSTDVYYSAVAPQVVDTVAVSAVGHLAAEAPHAPPAAKAPGAGKTVVSLADSLLPSSPLAMLATKSEPSSDSVSSSAVAKLLGEAAFGAPPPAPSAEARPDLSCSVLEGLGVAFGQQATSSVPAEGYLPGELWAQQPEAYAWMEQPVASTTQPSAGDASWCAQPSAGLASWAEPASGALQMEGGGAPYCPGQPPVLSLQQEPWGAPAMPAPEFGGVALSPPSPPSRPALGTEELPSIGSQAHASGTCKPCAFLHTKGCENGLSCQFCHLCENGEKKRRRKAKLESQRAMRQAKQTLAGRPA